MADTRNTIVAAYDGSAAGTDALCWAARSAAMRAAPLTVFLGSDLAPPGERALDEVIALAARRGEHALARGLERAGLFTNPATDRVLLSGRPPAQALCALSAAAEMVVLGSHGHGHLPGLPLGSVPTKVATLGHGRVVVVRGKWQHANSAPGPVAVGVDASPGAREALAFAFEEAALRDTLLLAVCALADSPGMLGEAREIEAEFGRLLSRLESEHPEVVVGRRVVAGAPRPSLLQAASEAQLIVVGSRGRTRMPEMRLGSVAHALLHHAPCPVAVVHPRRGEPGRSAAARPDIFG